MLSRVAKRKQRGEIRGQYVQHRKYPFLILILLFMCVGVYYLPPVYDRLAWRVAIVRADIAYALNPPEQVVFLPGDSKQQEAMLDVALQKGPTNTKTPTPTYTIISDPAEVADEKVVNVTPLPSSVKLEGVLHEYQRWSNCGPATLSMALSFWGLEGTQFVTADILNPNDRDVNVMPYEMAAYVEKETELNSLVRVGGNLELIKNLIANGFPVILEKGFEQATSEGWIGHYSLITGYDDQQQIFISQDSFMGMEFKTSYEQVAMDWQAFNYTFILLYSSAREGEAMAALGAWADEDWAIDHALEIANQQTEERSGRELYFAWYNKGTNHNARREFENAALAYDIAFVLNNQLAEELRPWRNIWYQNGPYMAYYNMGRYQDVIDLANLTLFAMSEQVLEESYYWRGLAKEALGNIEGAISDFRRSVQLNTNFWFGYDALNRLGVSP